MKARGQAIPNVFLRQQRIRRHWTQTMVARLLGTTYLSVCRWENGTTTPSLYFRKRLCDLFELPPEDIGLASTPSSAEASRATLDISPAAAIWTIPFKRNPFFTGREDILRHIHTLLHADKQRAAVDVLAISGLGGLGKTQTAIEYAYRFRESYQAVLWCRAETRNLLLTDLTALAGDLNLREKEFQDQKQVLQAIRHWLQTSPGWLLILDNLEHIPLVEEVLPSEYNGHVLLTTRAQSMGAFARRIDLERMEPEEGALFLLRRAKLIRAEMPLGARMQQAKEISHLMDGLPLALDQAGAYIEETNCTLADYVERYHVRHTALLHRRGEVGINHPEPVDTTMSLALGKVERLNPAAVELLRLCAFLDPDAIPEEILTTGADELGPLLGPVTADPVLLDSAIADLRRYSLLRRNPESKVLTMHRLVQIVIKDSLDEQSQQQWAERCVRIVNRRFPADEFSNWQQCQQLLSHALMCADGVKRWRMDFLEAAQLLARTGSYLVKRGQYQAAEPLLTQALSLYEQMLGSDHPTVALRLNELANLYWYQGKYTQATPLLQRALEIREQRLGPAHADVAESLNDLGVVSHYQGHYALAERLFTRAIAIGKQDPENDRSPITHFYNNLGSLYCDQGNYEQAEMALQKALTLRRQSRESNHPDLAFSLVKLAFLSYKQGRYPQAETLFQQALAIREQSLGPRHTGVAYALDYMALLSTAQGNYTQAELLFQRALTIYEQALGAEYINIAHTLTHLALLYHQQDQAEKAEPLLIRALAICERAQDSNYPQLAMSFHALAQVYLAQNHLAQAEPLVWRALAMCTQHLGAEHPDTATYLTTLGKLYWKQGKDLQAEQTLQQALSLCKQRLGADHPDTARSQHQLARLYCSQGRYEEAELLFQQALTTRKRCLGALHPETLATQEHFATFRIDATSPYGCSSHAN